MASLTQNPHWEGGGRSGSPCGRPLTCCSCLCFHGAASWARYFHLRSRVKRFMLIRVLGHKQVYLGSFRTFLFDQYSLHMLGHIANFTSLIAWLSMLVWTRMFYNAPVYPFNRDLVPERTFWLFIESVYNAVMLDRSTAQPAWCRSHCRLFVRRYGVVFAGAELLELGVLRVFAKVQGVAYFDKVLSQLKLRRARWAFIWVAAHVLQDAMVALVRVEPNTFHVSQ